MGYKFRLSDFIPNAWIYKPRRTRTQKSPTKKKQPNTSSSSSSSISQPHQNFSTERKSYYFTRDLTQNTSPIRLQDSPRKSPKKKRNPNRNSSDTFDNMVILSCSPDAKYELPPIITKKQPQTIRRSSARIEERNAYGSLSVRIVKEDIIKEERITTPVKRFSSSPGMKLRTNSPRIISHRKTQSVSRKTASNYRRSLSESVAVVKTSEDPHRDFKESMVEMIMENNIRTSKDLEELLACYLSLNSDEYHDMIIKVFKQIWFDVTDVRFK